MESAEKGGRSAVDPDAYLIDCFRLARDVWGSGYRPDFVVALWPGGASPGIVIQEFFRWRGHDPYHTVIRTGSHESRQRGDGSAIIGFDHILDVGQSEDRLLLVDDLFDSGRTISEVVGFLNRKAGRNAPEVRVATIYFRPGRGKSPAGPDYCLHEIEEPPLLPHRLSELTEDAVRSLDPELHEALYG